MAMMATKATAPTAIPAIAPLLSPLELWAGLGLLVDEAAALDCELVVEAEELDDGVVVGEMVAMGVAAATVMVELAEIETTLWGSIVPSPSTAQQSFVSLKAWQQYLVDGQYFTIAAPESTVDWFAHTVCPPTASVRDDDGSQIPKSLRTLKRSTHSRASRVLPICAASSEVGPIVRPDLTKTIRQASVASRTAQGC